MTVARVLVLGGYGNFGKRIVQNLAMHGGITLLVAGRNCEKARQLCGEMTHSGCPAALEPVVLDFQSEQFADNLRALSPDLVIHTGGPFQGQNYRVPQACIDAQSHYIDLADDRRYVCDIGVLDRSARESNVLVVTGASSVPGLSSTVVDHFMQEFSSLDEIDFAIAPGNQAERGEATVRGILSYTGHPFRVFCNGEWIDRYGWMSPRKMDFGQVVGKRWLANIDIPDLEIFPARYQPVRTVQFQAGLELAFLHFGMVFMAALVKHGVVNNWSVLTRPIFRASEWFKRFGSDDGAMLINLSGADQFHRRKTVKWTLCAPDGAGPYIPTISAIVLAKKLIDGELTAAGAMPCLGMYTLKEFDREAAALGIYHQTEVSIG